MEAEKTKEELEKEIAEAEDFIKRNLDKDTESILTDKVKIPITDFSVLPETIAALREEVVGLKAFVREILKDKDYRKGEITCKETVLELQSVQQKLKEQGMAHAHCMAVEDWLVPIVWQLEALTKDQIHLNALANGAGEGF